MSRRAELRVAVAAASLAALSACIDFDAKRTLYCEHNPGLCDGGVVETTDSGLPADAGSSSSDAGTDAGGLPFDAGTTDAGPGTSDAGTTDAGPATSDAGTTDAGSVVVTDAGSGPSVDAGFCRLPLGGFDAGTGSSGGSSSTISYVNGATGLDTNVGSLASPWKTLTHALQTATSGSEIHVCAGAYTGPFVMNTPLMVRGSYSCGSWTRTTTYGYGGLDGGFDGVNTTTLQASASAFLCGATFTVSGTSISRASVIDGFTILGNSCGTNYSNTPAALQVGTSARPTVTNNQILGGSGTGGMGAIGTFGLLVTSSAAPDVAFNRITGGSGVSVSREGSVAVFLDGNPGPVHVHDNVILGGSGTGASTGGPAIGSLGIGNYSAVPLTAANGAAIERNFISGGSGSDTNASGYGSVGVFLYYSGTLTTDLLDNVIEGGTGSNASNLGSVAVLDQAHADVLLTRNTLDVGDPVSGTAVGVFVDPFEGMHTYTNNVIRSVRGTAAKFRDIQAKATPLTSALFSHNTVFIGPGWAGLQLDSYRTNLGLTVDDNLFLSTGGVAIVDNSCGASFSSLRSNAFIGAYAELSTGACGVAASPADLATHYAQASGNFITASTCAVTTGCVPRAACVNATTCIKDVVAFDTTDSGLAALRSHSAWPPAFGAPCQLFTAGINDSATVLVDFSGKTRASPPTIGAVEPGCCGY